MHFSVSAVSKIELTGVKPVLIAVFEFDERASERASGEKVSEMHRARAASDHHRRAGVNDGRRTFAPKYLRTSGYRGDR